jgi:hypothetical protein
MSSAEPKETQRYLVVRVLVPIKDVRNETLLKKFFDVKERLRIKRTWRVETEYEHVEREAE